MQNTTKKLLFVLLADKTTHENMGRALHALLYAKQAKEGGIEEVEIIFDGGGTEWPAEMSKKESHFNALYEELLNRGVIKGVCSFCASAFKVEDELKAIGANFIGEDNGHPNIGSRIAGGWEVLVI